MPQICNRLVTRNHKLLIEKHEEENFDKSMKRTAHTPTRSVHSAVSVIYYSYNVQGDVILDTGNEHFFRKMSNAINL
jgi:hypothetical protein